MKAKCCPGCKLLASLDKNFCYFCGDKLPVPKGFEQLKCGQCGCGLLDDHRFCPNCGLSREESLKPKLSDEATITSLQAVCLKCGTEMILPSD